jgi:hypothetical protein
VTPKRSNALSHNTVLNLAQNQVSSTDRRRFISVISTAAISCRIIASSNAVEAESEQSNISSTAVIRGVVKLKPGTEVNPSDSAALYVTAKPETTINAPKAIAEMFAGRPPPILTARFPISSGSTAFPFQFELTESDVTAEGSYGGTKYWWSDDNLVVSARLDSDGIAATRDPDDLVGRTVAFVADKDSRVFRYDKPVELQLQDRGIGGKFITSKKIK